MDFVKVIADAALPEKLKTVETPEIKISEINIGEQSGLLEQMDTIRYGSLEAVVAKNEVAIKEASQIELNRIDGAAREAQVLSELEKDYPSEEGYTVQSESYLRNETGEIVKDPVTGEARRIDLVVIKDGQVIKSVEVTSETAPKDVQSAKEDRIREAGGNFVKDQSTGELVQFASGVKTEIVRRA